MWLPEVKAEGSWRRVFAVLRRLQVEGVSGCWLAGLACLGLAWLMAYGQRGARGGLCDLGGRKNNRGQQSAAGSEESVAWSTLCLCRQRVCFV